MTIVLDTPDQINAWHYLSAVSQLSFEIETGHNFYGKTSVLKPLQAKGWVSVTGRATKINKMIALTELTWGQESSPIIDLARKALQVACDEMGVDIAPEAV